MLKKKRFHLPKALRKYWTSYYNGNLLRNYRMLLDKEQTFINKENELITFKARSLTAYKYGDSDDSLKRAPAFLMREARSKDYGTLAGEITYYKTLEDFKEGKLNTRYFDRLFIDLDVDDNDKVKALKEEFKQANTMLEGKDLQSKYVELQKDFQDLIFNEDLLFDVYNEAQRLCSYLSRYGLKPYLIASGSKGYHVNIFFDEIQLTNLSQISETLAMSYSKELNLKYIDTKVFDKNKAHKRLQRCQYGRHGRTNLITRPLPLDVPYEDMLDLIQNKQRRPIDFDFNEYKAPEGFSKMLLKLDKEIAFKNAQRRQELERINTAKKKQLEKKYGKGYKSFQDIDLRDIANAYGIDGQRDGDKLIVNCPFHHDVHPSGVVFRERFYCSTCNIVLNYYEFISRLEGTSDKDKIILKAMEFLE